MTNIVLASASPRRIEMLRRAGLDFDIVPANLVEEHFELEDPFDSAVSIATAKARFVAQQMPDRIVLAADTIVALPQGDRWRQFGKPVDKEDAFRILSCLSGRRHSVISGVAIVRGRLESSFVDSSMVTFRALSDEDILEYVEGGEPMDKAGAYAIQGGASGFVESIEGDINTIIGMPLGKVLNLLSEMLKI